VSVFDRSQNVPSTSIAKACIETLEDRRLMSVSPLALGVNTNYVTSTNYRSMVSLLRQSGSTSVRLWYGFDGYGDRTAGRAAYWAAKFKYDGFDVTMTVNPEGGEVGTYDQTVDEFKYIVSVPGLTQSVDRWEIGNEEDSSNYWKGNFKQYVGQFLAPAASVLHSVGEKVVSGGVSWNPADVQKLVDQGMLRYVDYVGYHPYRTNYNDLVQKVAQVKEIAQGKPLVATEWNVRGHEKDASKNAWANDVAKFWPVIRDNFYAAYYYAATVVDTPAGPAGLMNADNSPNTPFYNVFMTFQDTVDTFPTSSTGSATSGGTTSSKPASGGSTSTGSKGTTNGSTSGSTTGGSTGSKGHTGSTTSGAATGGSKSTGSTGTKTTTSSSSTGTKTSTGSKGTTTSTKPTKPTKPSSGTVATTKHNPTPPPKPVAPGVSSISLINADRDRFVSGQANLTGTVTIDLSQVGSPNFSFVANVSKTVKSVVWSINGTTLVDSAGAFTLFGEKHRNIVGSTFKPGTYVITAQAFGGLDATGTAGRKQTYRINFIQSVASYSSNAAQLATAAYLKAHPPRLTPGATVAGRLGLLSGVRVA